MYRFILGQTEIKIWIGMEEVIFIEYCLLISNTLSFTSQTTIYISKSKEILESLGLGELAFDI